MNELEIIKMSMPDAGVLESAINLLLCIVCAFILRTVFIRKSVTLAGKFHIGAVIPLLALVVFLVIMIVKSSLALSLGLVGALSIVRFRTPIKEPEELVYLFVAIALGLGFGAGQPVVTISVFLVLISIITLFLSRETLRFDNEYNLVLEWSNPEYNIETAIELIKEKSHSLELSKYGMTNGISTAFIKIRFKPEIDIKEIGDSLGNTEKTISYSFYEARPLQ